MFEAAKRQVIRKIGDAQIVRDPFPHLRVAQIFPDEFYDRLLREIPSIDHYTPLIETGRVTKSYSPHRLALFPEGVDQLTATAGEFWGELFDALLDAELARTVFTKFQGAFKTLAAELAEAGNAEVAFHAEGYLMRDEAGYELGPHTDSPAKLVSMLFYLPAADDRPDLGTSLYVPKDPGFFCAGGPHHPFELFERVYTAPYRRNTLLAFPKTERCFHGVEPVPADGAHRDLLLYDLRRA